MSGSEITRLLGGWEGYRVGTVQRFEAGEKGLQAEVWIELLPLKRRRMRCSGCGELVSKVHDIEERWIRDLPLLDAKTWLLVWRRRVRCPSCGAKLEELPWLGRYSRVTMRLAESIGRLCQVASIKHVASFFGMSWWAVKAVATTSMYDMSRVIRNAWEDTMTAEERTNKMANDPKELVIVPGARHIDLHDRVGMIPFDKLGEFFSTALK